MFIHHVEFWLQGYPDHIQEYIGDMIESGKIELTDFEEEVKILTSQMQGVEKYGVDFMYMWSVRDHLTECMRWYVE